MTLIENNNGLKWSLLALLTVVLSVTLANLPLNIGVLDYRGYWSASYLLGQGENFTDDALLLQTEQSLTNFQREFPIKTWNPPWVLAWLLPYTWFGFRVGANLWLMTNISMLFMSIVLGWKMLFPASQEGQKWLWVPFILAALFPSTIVSLLVGQTNLIVLGGLVGFLYFYQSKQDISAGFVLTLTTFKPHLVYLVVPLLLLWALRERRWKVLLSFGSLLLLSTGIVYLLRPEFVSDYLQSTSDGNLLGWETATVVTYLSFVIELPWIRLISIGLLPITIIIWLVKGQHWQMIPFALWGVLWSINTMPFGWSYDFVLLLFPMTQLLIWLITLNFPIIEKILLWISLLIIYAIFYAQRIATPSELFFYWVPVAILILYSWVAWRKGSVNNELVVRS